MSDIVELQELAENVSEDVKNLNPIVFRQPVEEDVVILARAYLPGTIPDAPGGKKQPIKGKRGRKIQDSVNKYGVAPKDERTYNGIVYHSKKESEYAVFLDWRVKRGDLSFWLRQVPFQLPGGAVYRLDFMTVLMLGHEEIGAGPAIKPFYSVEFIEVKGMKLAMGELKRRQVEELYGIEIKVV